jgi:hypothetical protein
LAFRSAILKQIFVAFTGNDPLVWLLGLGPARFSDSEVLQSLFRFLPDTQAGLFLQFGFLTSVVAIVLPFQLIRWNERSWTSSIVASAVLTLCAGLRMIEEPGRFLLAASLATSFAFTSTHSIGALHSPRLLSGRSLSGARYHEVLSSGKER